MTRWGWIVTLLDLLLLLWAATELPARVASHFDLGGAADAYASRGAFLVAVGGLVVGVALAFAGVSRWLRGSMPFGVINLPGKETWRAAGREQELRAMLAADLAFIGLATQLLVGTVLIATVRAHAVTPPRLPGWSWVALLVYLAVVLGYTGWMMAVRYRRPPETGPSR